ncbi:hypothetical protein HMPREF3144_01855 [Oligella sp. HMSC05A10]|uniref:DUF4390 domain-containing protein n=1 Tax=Oligella sp. HMSC05A10 TaxID=1581112 RepID=UPI0008A24BCA|nr:DUF4390 domain-containing protein [Oligella sp. HMSC05A10]OFS88552.1 hypothetical protein HMPREF3144_01855 [Oligella sp. HMSC05A10]
MMKQAKQLFFKLRWRLLLLLCIAVAACSQTTQPTDEDEAGASSSGATVEAIEVLAYEIGQNGPRLQLKADLALQPDPELVNAALRGVPLNFVYEIEISEPYWYFFKKKVAYQSQAWLINYQPLLRQWSVKDNQRTYQEISLEDSLEHISSTKTWTLSLDAPLARDKVYTARLRLHLDTTQLPGAFQFNLFNFRSVWSLSSEWQSLLFQPSI